MKKNIIIPIVAALMSVVFAVGAALTIHIIGDNKRNCYDIITVYINENYKDRYLSKEFKVEDFGLNDIKSLAYLKWVEMGYPFSTYGPMHLYLNTKNKDRASEAINQLLTLDFVEHAMIESKFMHTQAFDVIINDTKRREFHTKQLTVEDFEYDNIEEIRYFSWLNTTGRIIIVLKQRDARQIFEAVEHFCELDFVVEARPIHF